MTEQLPELEQLVLLERLPDVMAENLLRTPPRTGLMTQFPADDLLLAFRVRRRIAVSMTTLRQAPAELARP